MTWVSVFLALLLLVLGIPSRVCAAGDTWVELTEADTGRMIFSAVLKEGEQIVLTWMNSLYGLRVTEVFEARGGVLFLTEVTYAPPQGPAPPLVPPEEAEELYQTGGPFYARELAKPFRKIVYRVAEIGEPKMKIRDCLVDFKKEVGFGGRIILTVKSADSL